MCAVRSILGLSVVVGSFGACGPTVPEGVCSDTLVAGDLVITEVFANYEAAGGGGIDEGKEWFEIYNASGRAIELTGLQIVHGRPDAEPGDQKAHTIEAGTIGPGQFLTFGNSTPELLSAYIDYGYSNELGEFFNSDGGKLVLRCGDGEIDAAIYDNIEGGRSRQLSAAAAPDYTVNDEQSNWCSADATEFEPGNFGTPGQDNDCTPRIAGQCRDELGMRATVSPAPGELVITEVMPSPASVGDDTGEWFEARALADFDLNGLGLDRASDSSNPQPIESDDCLRVRPGDHVLFARSADTTVNGQLFPNATFRFSLVGGTATAPGDVRIMSGAAIIDAVTWTSARNGRSLSLDPDFTTDTGNDDPSNFCDGTTAYHSSDTAMDFGTPGAANAQCTSGPPTGQCLDGGAQRPIVKPVANQLVITEFMPDPTGTDATQEWFEIKNTGAAFDLNGLTLKGNATTANTIAAAECKRIAAGGFALFARGTDPAQNGMLPAVDATFSFGLVQSNGSVSVLDGATVLDAITWTDGIAEGTSKQLQPAQTTTTANDNPANFCNAAASQTYGTANRGTPKAANACL